MTGRCESQAFPTHVMKLVLLLLLSAFGMLLHRAVSIGMAMC